ncbi:hypothetical protein VT03_00635 [Planctomyces sp. SH-PL14]|nr:hypothetical protein VT03_00635 [Planctomyces sp. SH-PL14]
MVAGAMFVESRRPPGGVATGTGVSRHSRSLGGSWIDRQLEPPLRLGWSLALPGASEWGRSVVTLLDRRAMSPWPLTRAG